MAGQEGNNDTPETENAYGLPAAFQPLLWSYEFAQFDPETHKRALVVQTINYGSLFHWRWIAQRFGKANVAALLVEMPRSELRPAVHPLASILFDVPELYDVSQRTHRGGGGTVPAA